MKHCTDLRPDWIDWEGVGPTAGVHVPFESTSMRPYVLSRLSLKNPAATHHAAVTQLMASNEPEMQTVRDSSVGIGSAKERQLVSVPIGTTSALGCGGRSASTQRTIM